MSASAFATKRRYIKANASGTTTDPPPSDPGTGLADVTAVSVWRTGGSSARTFESMAAINTAHYGGTAGTYPISLDTATRKHQITGWGGAVTQAAAKVLMGMSSANRNTLLNSIFNPVTGLGTNFIRICFGSPDYEEADGSTYSSTGVNWSTNIYTYCDLGANASPDTDLSSFSIGSNGTTKTKDYKYIIPVLKLIKAINPNIKILATVWSPPRWMKQGLPNAYPNNSWGTLQATYRTLFGTYVRKACEAYAAENLMPDWVSIQNEPTTQNDWAACQYAQGTDAVPVYKTVRAALDASSTASAVKIMCLDNGLNRDAWVRAVYADTDSKAAVDGHAFHTYAPGVTTSVIAALRADFPAKGCWITEGAPGKTASIAGNSANNWAGGLVTTMARFYVGSTRDGSQGTMYWNLCLDEDTGPYYTHGNSGFSQPFYTVNSNNDNVTKNLLHYALSHMTTVMKPGAWVCPADDYKGDGYLVKPDNPLPMTGWDVVACVNLDGSRGLVITGNPSNTASRTFDVIDGTRHFQVVVGINEVVSLSWAGA